MVGRQYYYYIKSYWFRENKSHHNALPTVLIGSSIIRYLSGRCKPSTRHFRQKDGARQLWCLEKLVFNILLGD